MSKDSDTEDELALSAHALAALQEFRLEQEKHQEEFRKIYQEADKEFSEAKKRKEGMKLFKEDWQLSQFWYTDFTADLLADALLEGADSDTVIAIVSAPSVYAAIKRKQDKEIPTKHIYLMEYDRRFELLAGKEHFLFYDYQAPQDFDAKLKGKVNRLIIDPPFLNEDCQTKSAITAKALLAKNDNSKTRNGLLKHRLISCTGERMSDVISKAYPDTKMTTFLPEHANGLSNEFRCYANFEWSGWRFSAK
ncbi:hypothetical protein HG537_0C04330 [Torulaspora globosa]|uniref:Protein-lysine N-methyltransferase EFM5 n=1 Tax=Torulaspora globosa TaxID=48254 RepID=A0A7H9HPR2_9SACH|nr:hypothetical protein HG537_0C04330 [Torulaspora sp. CBS 2947]